MSRQLIKERVDKDLLMAMRKQTNSNITSGWVWVRDEHYNYISQLATSREPFEGGEFDMYYFYMDGEGFKFKTNVLREIADNKYAQSYYGMGVQNQERATRLKPVVEEFLSYYGSHSMNNRLLGAQLIEVVLEIGQG